jgi:hypothetical protein
MDALNKFERQKQKHGRFCASSASTASGASVNVGTNATGRGRQCQRDLAWQQCHDHGWERCAGKKFRVQQSCFFLISGTNTIINEAGGIIPDVIGAYASVVNFTNMGSVIGSLVFTSGARDQLHIYTGSTVTGAIGGSTQQPYDLSRSDGRRTAHMISLRPEPPRSLKRGRCHPSSTTHATCEAPQPPQTVQRG